MSHRKTASEYLEQTQKMLNNDNLTNSISSYVIFLILLGKVITRFVQTDAKNQIMKIKGKTCVIPY